MIGLILVILVIALFTGAEIHNGIRESDEWQWRNDVRVLVRSSRRRHARPLKWANYRG